MRRGFKASAERQAASVRLDLGIAEDEPVDLDELAESLDVELFAADELVEREQLERLERLQPYAFSAATFELPGGRRAVVHNSLHDAGRTKSNVSHELAHGLLGHELSTIERVNGIPFVSCDTEQEQEANWLGGCLLLPRPLLLKAARLGHGPQRIAEMYEVTEAMARWRLNASGVLLQIRRSGRRA